MYQWMAAPGVDIRRMRDVYRGALVSDGSCGLEGQLPKLGTTRYLRTLRTLR